MLDYVIDGTEVELYGTSIANVLVEIVDGLTVVPVLLEEGVGWDANVSDKRHTLAIRIRSVENPDYEVGLSHVYYA